MDSNIDPLLDLDISCRGHINSLIACQENSPEAKLVFASSRFVYGRIDYNPVDEAHPFNCLSIYGIHKLAGEKYYRFFHDAYGMHTTSVRIANPYGPRQQMKHSKYGIVNWFIRLALEEQPLTVFGDGRQVRDYIYVEDVAKAMLAVCLSQQTDGQVFNLGSGTGTPFIDMVAIIAKLIPGTKIKMVEWPADRYFVETGDYISDISLLKETVDWSPQITLEQGIAQTIDYYRICKQHYW